MNLQEFQAKELLSRFSVPVPRGRIADSAADAERVARRLGFERFVVKAQVRAGDRMAMGAIRFSASPEGVGETARLLLTPPAAGAARRTAERVRWVLIEDAIQALQLLYAAVYLDKSTGQLVLMAAETGGSSIETRAAFDPSLVVRTPLAIRGDGAEGDFAGVALRIGLVGEAAAKAEQIFRRMAAMAVAVDATQVEVNPLARTWDGDFVALDAKVVIDRNALSRHPGLAALSAAQEAEEGDALVLGADRHHINYHRLDGDIGVVVNGAGLALATLDQIVDAGGAPANFMDIRTTATSLDVAYGVELILAEPNIKVLLVNVHGGGMQPCDTIAEGVGIALSRSGRKPAIVVRMVGNNAAFAETVLANHGVVHETAADMAAAARMAVRAAHGSP